MFLGEIVMEFLRFLVLFFFLRLFVFFYLLLCSIWVFENCFNIMWCLDGVLLICDFLL